MGGEGLVGMGEKATSGELREAMIRISQGKNSYGPAEVGRARRAVARAEDVRYEGASGDLRLGATGRVSGVFEAWRLETGKVARRALP